MKTILGLLLLIGGIVLGIWLGVFVMFIGGIAQFIDAVKMTPINAMGMAVGFAKFLFSGAVGWISFIVVGGSGCALISSK